MKPTRTLAENFHWNEIAALARLAVVSGQQVKHIILNQYYVPEIVHLVTLIAGTGDIAIRLTVWGLAVELLQSFWMFRTSAALGSTIPALFELATQAKTLKLFGLFRICETSELVCWDPRTDAETLDNHEALTRFLIRIMESVASSKGMLT